MLSDPEVVKLMMLIHKEDVSAFLPQPEIPMPGGDIQPPPQDAAGIPAALETEMPIMAEAEKVNMPRPPKGTDPRSAEIINNL